MNINSNSLNSSQNFNGTLKIYDCGGQFNRFKNVAIKRLESNFAERTQGIDGHMDVLLFNRTSNNCKLDKFEFTDGKYKDSAEINLNNYSDDNTALNKFVDTFCAFKSIKNIKENMGMIFK